MTKIKCDLNIRIHPNVTNKEFGVRNRRRLRFWEVFGLFGCDSGHSGRIRGFTLLFAVLLGSLLFSLGLAISHIAIREVILSASGKSSETAFYAADAGIECALYNDIQKGAFPSSKDDPQPGSIMCNGQLIKVSYDMSDDNSIFFSSFRVSFSPICAEVRVEKWLSGVTIIESRGRNDCGVGNNPGRVERALRVTY